MSVHCFSASTSAFGGGKIVSFNLCNLMCPIMFPPIVLYFLSSPKQGRRKQFLVEGARN